MNFKIQQIALHPNDPAAAKELLSALGAVWTEDHVKAGGWVFGEAASNEADLAFDYEMLQEARELEVLNYTHGTNWMDNGGHEPNRVSHLGTHCTAEELARFREFFAGRGISVAQEVFTSDHTNEFIRGKRWYNYVIFNTYPILGVDLKFIVRRNQPPVL